MHWISGLVAPLEPLRAIGAAHGLGRPAALAFGLGFLPIDEENLDRIVVDDVPPRDEGVMDGEAFSYLGPALTRWCADQSAATRLAFVETQYWGGGGQGAAVFDRGEVIREPTLGPGGRNGPISSALAMLGVSPGDAYDEFDAAGISWHSSNDSWRAAAEGA